MTRASQILRALEAQRIKPDPTRDPTNEHEAKLLAERSFQAGLELVKGGKYGQAAPELQRAARLLPQSEEYRLYAKWCMIRARTNEPPHALERAELGRMALSAIKADPNFGFGYFIAEEMASHDGDDKQALRLLTRAVKLDPFLLEAQRLLRVVERKLGR